MLNNMSLFDSSIMIVDYDPLSSQQLNDILMETGYKNISLLNDPKEVLRSYRDESPELIFLDLRMPGLGGIEVLDDLKTLCRKNYLPVIVLSGLADLEIRLMAFKWGVKEFLGQPYNVNEVRFRARHVLETAQKL